MNFLSREIVFAAGIIAAPAFVAGSEAPNVRVDERIPILRNLFASYKSPLKDYAAEFLNASDKHGLDWRLLPSLTILETGGRHYNGNNLFGWGNGVSRFPSVASAIEVVAKYLSTGAPYRGKSFEAKMRTYNPRQSDYAIQVKRMMARIAPDPRPVAKAPSASVH